MTDESSSSSSSPSFSDTHQHYSPIHQASFDGDLKQLKKEIEKRKMTPDFDVNIKDTHGNTSLHLAIHNKHREVVEYLLTVPGIQPSELSRGGWSPLQEAVASGEVGLVEMLYRASQTHYASEIRGKIPLVVKALKEVPDLSVEIQWGFSSWIPFVSRFCPSDRYKIWKKGSNFRIDSTLIGYENLQWVRGSMSAIFNGDNKNDHEKVVYVIDHNQKIVDLSMPTLSEDHDPQQEQQEIEELMKLELLYFDTSPVTTQEEESTTTLNTKINFKPCVSWTGAPKTSFEGGFPCTLYEMEGLSLSLQQRIMKDRVESQPIDNSVGDPLKVSFADYIKEDKGKTKPLLYVNEVLIQKEKSFKSIAHLSREFPLKVNNLLPLLDLFPSSPRVDKIREIFRSLPENYFPVKIEIPVFPTVTGTITFEKFSTSFQNTDDLFSIPPDYTIV